MPRYFFHLAGRLPANDLIGHECSNDHGSFIAHRVGTEKPDMVHEGNFISVTNEAGEELFKIPIASTLIAITRDGRGDPQISSESNNPRFPPATE
jgi:hypothetical protein